MNILFQCLGLTGAILLGYGLVGYAVTQVSSTFFWVLMVLGSIMVVVFVVTGKSFIKEVFQQKSLRYGTSSAIYTVIVLAIIAVANVVSQDFNAQKDLTENKVNTLTEQSVNVLDKLKEPLKVYAFYDPRHEQKGFAKVILKKYENESKNFQVEFIDPDTDRVLAEKYGARDGDLVFEYQERTHTVRDLSEEKLTEAIIKVYREVKPKICFTKGHGEYDILADNEAPRSMSFAKMVIEREGYVTESIDTLLPEIEPTCLTVVIAGPQEPFSENEAAALDRYLSSGGTGFFLMDPVRPDLRLPAKQEVLPTGLDSLLIKYGANLGKDYLLEKHLELFQGVKTGLTVRAHQFGNHPIVDPLKGRQVLLDQLRSVRKAKDFDGTAIPLMLSGKKGVSWAETDIDRLFRKGEAVEGEGDLPGPVTLAIAASQTIEDKPTKIVVVGDSDFAGNNLIYTNETNLDFFLNSINWLQGEEENISIRPKVLRSSTIELTAEQANMIFYVAIVGIPMLALIFGVNLWWYRRRRG